MSEIIRFLKENTIEGMLSLAAQKQAAKGFSISMAQVEKIALENTILPVRYQRNREMITVQQQLTLLTSSVIVLGCGGLGGYIIEELARLGVGTIRAVDPDVFEEHNLNRQLLATPDLLGQKKAEGAARRIAEINPAVLCQPVTEALNGKNGLELLQGMDLAIDALDSISTRLILADLCSRGGIPLVHGTIGGWYGRVATQFPGDETIRQLYPRNREMPGIEASLGNPSFTPAVIASLQVAEVIKIILKTGEPLRGRYLAVDLYHMEVNEILLNNAKTRDTS